MKFVVQFIIFPEECPIKENELRKEVFLLIEKDDIDGFVSFLSKNPIIDITEEQKLEGGGYYCYLFNSSSISLIDFCCFLVHWTVSNIFC